MGKKFENNKKYYFSKEELTKDLGKSVLDFPAWVIYSDKKRVYFDNTDENGAYGKVLCEGLHFDIVYYVFPEWCIGEEC